MKKEQHVISESDISWDKFEADLKSGSVKTIAPWVLGFCKKDLSQDELDKFYQLCCHAVASKYFSKSQWLSITKQILKKKPHVSIAWLFFTSWPNAVEVFENNRRKNSELADDSKKDKLLNSTLQLLILSVAHNDEARFNEMWAYLSDIEQNVFLNYSPIGNFMDKSAPLLPSWLIDKLPKYAPYQLNICVQSYLKLKETTDVLTQMFSASGSTLIIDFSSVDEPVNKMKNRCLKIVKSFEDPSEQLKLFKTLQPKLRKKLFENAPDIHSQYEHTKFSQIVNKNSSSRAFSKRRKM